MNIINQPKSGNHQLLWQSSQGCSSTYCHPDIYQCLDNSDTRDTTCHLQNLGEMTQWTVTNSLKVYMEKNLFHLHVPFLHESRGKDLKLWLLCPKFRMFTNTVPDVKAWLGFPQEWDIAILTFTRSQLEEESEQFCTKKEAKEAVKGQESFAACQLRRAGGSNDLPCSTTPIYGDRSLTSVPHHIGMYITVI